MSAASVTRVTQPHPVTITPAMLQAGRRAFLEKRNQLDDLHQYFSEDLTEFLSHIFGEMARAA